MYNFARVCSGLSVLFATTGVICYFVNFITISIVCGVLLLLNSFIQITWGEQNNIGTEIATIIIAIVVSLIFKLKLLPTVAVALCIVELLLFILGIIPFLCFLFSNKKN